MPMWLLEYLLTNKVPSLTVHKISFVLLPWPHDNDPLPELLNTYVDVCLRRACHSLINCSSQSKLTASRFLRVRKLTNHVRIHLLLGALVRLRHCVQVQEKLDKIDKISMSPRSQGTPRSSLDGKRPSPSSPSFKSSHSGPKAEDIYQIMCNDVVLPLDMTLAAVRQFVWRQSAMELTMYYRRRVATPLEEGNVLVARAL